MLKLSVYSLSSAASYILFCHFFEKYQKHGLLLSVFVKVYLNFGNYGDNGKFLVGNGKLDFKPCKAKAVNPLRVILI